MSSPQNPVEGRVVKLSPASAAIVTEVALYASLIIFTILGAVPANPPSNQYTLGVEAEISTATARGRELIAALDILPALNVCAGVICPSNPTRCKSTPLLRT